MREKHRKLVFFGVIFGLALFFGLFLIKQKQAFFQFQQGQTEKSINEQGLDAAESLPKSPISGVPCENAIRRPIAVMLSSDKEARPLSGISQADLVFEMPVVERGTTRLMAVFVCEEPPVIGSVRSARHDFIPLAAGLDAIYAHWGGSYFALDKLKNGAIDNLDALPNPNNVFYRQSGIPMPHNGFTSTLRLENTAAKLGYRIEGKFSGYPHRSGSELPTVGAESKILRVDYPGEFRVSYQYQPETNSYFRYRGNSKEIDKNNKQQAAAKNVVIMRAQSRPLEGQYNEVQVGGEGEAEYYLGGQRIEGKWSKDKSDIKSKLTFKDNNGQEVKFVPGPLWIEIAEPGTPVTWE